MPMLLTFELCIAAVVSINFLEVYGRKLHIIAGTSACTVCLTVVSIGYFINNLAPFLSQLFIIFGLLIYLFCFGLTFSPVVWMYIPEVVQPNLVGYPVMGNWFGASIVMILFPIGL
jgi:hypothetical protein